MRHFFRAVAVDYDGTLTDGIHPPQREVLDALWEVRGQGRRVILCTGRILAELEEVFPEVERHFDAIVAENGAVVVIGGDERPMAEPVPPTLAERLRNRGVPVRHGRVLLATRAQHDVTALEEIRRLGLECQLVRNRNELMILPAGISKGWGLHQALAELGISHHSTLAVGDAENDLSLLEAAEVGVAVANAVASLAEAADVVLQGTDGEGVLSLLHGPLLQGDLRVEPRRWRVLLGSSPDGTPVTVPASRINVLVTGGPASGKSYLAGLFVEQLVRRQYSVCVFDAEGDHGALDQLRGVLSVGGVDPPPDPAHLDRLLRHRFGSLVLDLSLLAPDEKRTYMADALPQLDRLRETTGLPHWIVVEEAAQLLKGVELVSGGHDPWGMCLVTFDPAGLSRRHLDMIDTVVALPGGEPWLDLPTSDQGTQDVRDLKDSFHMADNQAIVGDREGLRPFTPAERIATHVRHWHKYMEGELPPERRFYFRDDGGTTGRCAANVGDFRREVLRAPDAVLRHHLQAGDFSRWISGVLADDALAGRLRSIERWYRASEGLHTGQARRAVVRAVERRYGPAPDPSEVCEPR